MSEQVQETGMDRFRRVQAEAKALGITGKHNTAEFEALIEQAKKGEAVTAKTETAPPTAVKGVLTPDEAAKIDQEMKYRFEAEEKFREERRLVTERASIVAESDLLGIEVDLPENPTELQLAKARLKLGMEKTAIKPSPETVAIEASKRGYYVFNNREQEDAAHTVNLGGKYTINLIPDQIHVLSEYHVRKWKQIATTPIYERVETGVQPGPGTTGQLAQECKKVAGRPRFMFEHLGEAPQDAPFGLVTDMEVLNKLRQPV